MKAHNDPHAETAKTADQMFAVREVEARRSSGSDCLVSEVVARAEKLIPFPHGPALTIYRATCLLPCE